MRARFIVVLFAVAAGPLLAGDVWRTDYESARDEARERRVPLLLFFTGSDWCMWCQKLENGLFASDTFQQAAQEHFMGIRLDFPRRTRLPLVEHRRNRLMRHRWKVEAFPTVIVVNPFDETAILRHSYTAIEPETYLMQLGAVASLSIPH